MVGLGQAALTSLTSWVRYEEILLNFFAPPSLSVFSNYILALLMINPWLMKDEMCKLVCEIKIQDHKQVL